MLFKQFNVVCRRLITHQKNILLPNKANNIKCCSTKINSNKEERKFDGPGLKDFITKDFASQHNELLNDEDKIPYVDIVDLGQQRNGKNINKFSHFKNITKL